MQYVARENVVYLKYAVERSTTKTLGDSSESFVQKFFLKIVCTGRVRSFRQAVGFVMLRVGFQATQCLS